MLNLIAANEMKKLTLQKIESYNPEVEEHVKNITKNIHAECKKAAEYGFFCFVVQKTGNELFRDLNIYPMTVREKIIEKVLENFSNAGYCIDMGRIHFYEISWA